MRSGLFEISESSTTNTTSLESQLAMLFSFNSVSFDSKSTFCLTSLELFVSTSTECCSLDTSSILISSEPLQTLFVSVTTSSDFTTWSINSLDTSVLEETKKKKINIKMSLYKTAR